MKRIASILGLTAVLGLPAAHAQTPLVQDYTTNTNFTATGTNERGIAYGVVGGNERLYMTSRAGGNFVYIYNPADGTFLSTAGNGSGSLNTTGVTAPGSTVVLNDVEVSDDGAIYSCNLTTNNATAPFTCYYWASEAAAPAPVTITGIPATASLRLGDRVRVTGSLASGLTMWLVAPAIASPAQAPQLYRCTASTYTAFACTTHDLGGVSVAGISNGSASPNPGSTTSIWLNGNSALPRLVTIPAVGDGAATLVTNIPAAQLGGTPGTGNNSIYAFRNERGDSTYVAMFEYSTNATTGYNRARIVNVTSIVNTGSNVGTYSWSITPSSGPNTSSGSGDIAIRPPSASNLTADLFVLRQNQDLGAFSTTTAGLPVELTAFTATADGNAARFAWTTASETNNASFALEQRTGTTWTERSTAPGRGTTSERADYATTVEGLAPGRHAFRLRQTDLDGTSTVVGTVTVEIAPESGLALVLLGDGQGGTRAVRLASRAAQPVTVRLYDVTGREVALLVSGETGATVDAAIPAGLAAGVYVVRATSGAASTTRTLVVR